MTGRLTPVRLTDIPPAVRVTAARHAAQNAADSNELLSLLAAAVAPSDRVYWIRADAANASREAA